MQPQGTDRLPVRLYLNQSMLRIDMASHKQAQLFKLEGEKQNTHLPLPFFAYLSLFNFHSVPIVSQNSDAPQRSESQHGGDPGGVVQNSFLRLSK